MYPDSTQLTDFVTMLQLIYIIIGVLSGLLVFASADLPLIWRETAINTRKDSKEGSNYSSAKLLSTLIKAIAILIWLALLIGLVEGYLHSAFLR